MKTLELELVKCVCHSIHLCSELDFLVRETYSWFSHSSLRQINYQAIDALINDGVKPLKIITPARTRWLSFGECINRIMHQWIELKHVTVYYIPRRKVFHSCRENNSLPRGLPSR
jgi:hypothetical protein